MRELASLCEHTQSFHHKEGLPLPAFKQMMG